MQFSQHIHFADGHLTRRTKEMIATYVSGLNRCWTCRKVGYMSCVPWDMKLNAVISSTR